MKAHLFPRIYALTNHLTLLLIFIITTLTIGNAWGAETYEKYSGTITEGDYIIVCANGAMKNTISSDRLQYSEVTITNNIISDPDPSIVWHIAPSGDYWTIYNVAVTKYAASTGAKNKAQLLSSATDDKSLWTVSGTSTYEFVNKKNKANSVNANLRRNGTYGFACYATTTGGALSLYKKASAATPHTVTFDAGSGTCNTSSLTESTAGDGVTLPTATICDGWEFAGWATSSVASETTTAPTTLLDEGSNYKPTGNCTLYAVYKRTETTNGGGNSVSESITIVPNTFADKGSNNYASGAERTGTVNEISLGGHYITGNQNNTPTGSTAGTYLQCQAKNATIYNKTKLPGNITKVVINQYDAKAFSLYCGSEQLMASNNTSTGQTPSGTKINDVTVATTMTWNVSGDYTYFALKKGSTVGYVTSIVVTYTTSSGGSTTYYHSTPQCATQTAITLSQQGGTSGTESVTATYGQPMPKITVPTRTGYDFQGYFTANGGTGTKYYNAEGTSAKNWDKKDAEFTLIAYWKAKTYTVTLDNQEATTAGATSVTATYNAAMPSIASNLPKKTGYTFQGYFDAISGGTKYYNADGTSAMNWDKTSATTLYAQWTCVDPTNINISGEYIRFPGETIELTVSGDNIAADASYVWKKGDQVITGQTTETLTIANATIANAGNYLCEVTNGTCSESGDFTIKMYSLRGLIDWHTDLVFVKESANIASYSIELNGNSSYEFKVFDGGAYYGNTGAEPTMTSTNCTNWPMQQNSGNNVTLKTVVSGIYTFKLDYSDSSNPTISVIYPPKKLYLNPGEWNCEKYAVYSWNGSDNSTVLMTKIDDCAGRNIYQAEIDASHSNVIFIGGTASYNVANTWNNVSHKSIDLTYPSDEKVLFDLTQPNTTHLFLTPNANWKNDGARFAAYFFGNGDTWSSLSYNDKENIYYCKKISGYPSVIFCRMNPSAAANNWDNKWNQSSDLTIPTNGTNHYTVKTNTWDKGSGTWSTVNGEWTSFTPNYSVTFDANGHGTAPANQCVAEGGEVTTPTEPTTDGYTFGGWYKEVGCTNAWDFANDVVTSDITLYAKWTINTHTLTWNVNGGNALTGTYTNGTLEYGTTITKPADPTRTGYTFLGWHDGTGRVTPATTMPDYDLTYTAQWQINSYTVTWNPDGGKWGSSTDNKVDTYEYGASINQPANPTREGYSFMGWSPAPEATMPDNNLTYTAQWAPQYTITWIVNGTPLEPTVSNSFTNSVTSGGEILDLPNAPDAPVACEGKVFVGWTTEEINEETDTKPTKLYKITDDFPAVTKNETYYAVWADEMQGSGSGNYELVEDTQIDYSGDYLIVYNNEYAMSTPNGNLNTNTYATYASIASQYNNKVITANNSTDALAYTIAKTTNGYSIYCKKNNTYLGITKATTATGSRLCWNSNYEESACDWIIETSDFISSIKNHGSNTLFIQWNNNSGSYRFAVYAHTQQDIQLFKKVSKGNTYSAYTTTCDDTKAIVNYNLNGGTGAECEEMKVTKGESFTLCAQTPERDHYDFDGWSDGTTSYAAGASVSVEESTTFYAKWTPKTYTITLNPNGGLLNHEEENIQIAFVYGSEVNPLTDYYETIEREGYDFTGWYSAQSGGSPWVNAETELDLVLYARWAQLYSVVYEVNGNTYVNQQYQYTNGETIVLPEAPSAANYACDGYLFAGWSATPQAAETSSCPTLVENDAVVSENMHLYAVWKKATTTGAGEIIFYESFNEYASPGGNDQNFNTASSTADNTISKSDEKGWSGTKVYGAKACIKLGGSDDKGSATTPALTQLSGNATLSFKAAAWNGTKEKNTLTLSVQGGGNLNKTSVTLTKGAWQDYEVTITGGTSTTRITFEGQNASNNRFFLDEVKVATSGSYNYTTSPNCGPTIVAKEGMWVTSAADQSVMVRVPISLNSFESNVTITGTCANTHFSVATLENVGNGVESLLVTYTPTEHNQTEDASITLTAHEGESVLSTTTFTLKGRSLPETFAVVAMKNAAYYALPANMPEAATYKGLHVNVEDDAVIAAPTTHLYSLKSVHNTRFEEHGTQVRLVGNNEACLWASNAKDGTNIRNWAVLSNAKEAQYEWNLYTEDGDTYTISCSAVTEEGRILRMYGDNLGMYKTGANVFRLMPVNCTEQPMNVQVSSTRVTATIAWTNAAACKVDVYLKSNSSLVNSIASKASPVTITGLTETTEYTFTLTPVGATDCAMNGAFKTSGPDIDIVEWMTDGVVIQVDKDENVNPKVVIKGEVEHNTGTGIVATELFFSKYFEAHGENKLLAIYNGTGAPIDLSGYEIKSENGTLDLSQFGQTKGTVAPNEEIILVYYDVTDNNKDNIPDHSAETCAQEQEGYEKWHKLANKSVLAFSGRGSIGLYKDDVLIDVIGSTFPTGDLTKIGKSVNGNECEPEDVQLYVEGVSVNDQSSFFCTNGDNIKTDEVETNYAISTNRCLLIRKNTVTSGANAVATNKATEGAKCGDLSSTFVTLCSEWAGFRIGSGNSNDDEVKEATCDGLGYVGGFDYNKYYREFETLDDSKTLDQFNYKPEENLYKLTIDNVAQYSCLNIQVQINDPVNGTVLTEQTAQVPILVTAANTTTDGLFSNIIDGDLDASKTRCSTCDVVVLNGATLTKAAAETANDVNQIRNVYIYPGAKLIVPENADDYSVNSISFRRVEEEVGSASVETTMNITSSSAAPIYVDVRVNAENWHWFTLPYDCNIADVTWVDGTPAMYGVDWFLSTYDGEKRAATQSGGCWAEFHGDVIKAGVGYIVGIAGYPNKPKVKYELRFPMSKDVLAKEKEDKTVPVYAWGVDENMRPTHKGWNLVGNPYLDYYKKNNLNSFGGLRLGRKYVLNQSTGYYEDSGEWDGVPGNLPYVVIPRDGGWSAYDQVLVSSIDLLPFTAYFVQVGNPETENNGDLKDVLFDGDNRGRASIARRAPSSVSEQEEPVIVGVSLTNSKGESDMTSLVIDDKYTDEYEMNADFFKWFGDYYRYYTKPVLYTIGTDNEQRAFNALPEVLAAQPVSVGTYTAQNGEYTFSLDRRSDLTRVKEVWLHDATENIHTNLMQGDYTFTAGRTDGSGRFSIAVSLLPKMPTDCVNGSANGVYVSAQQRTLYLHRLPEKARVWVYDAVGKLLVQETTQAYQRAYKLNQAGVYFVRVESQEGTVTLQAIVE